MSAAQHGGGASPQHEPAETLDAARRRWLKGMAVSGLVLAVGHTGDVSAQTAASSAPLAPPPPKYGAERMPGGVVDNPLVFVSIGADGWVSVVCHRSEMGQGVRTALPRIVADELEADLARVTLLQAVGDAKYGIQNTEGSQSVRLMFEPLRVAAPKKSKGYDY